ncbi:MAG: serine/threonine protein kinase [Kofleriaceae bacterium]|nr:serine/threonine protein kinase [Kofleriaceae bacterium]
MIGETLGSYRIERRLGEGGMGTVYLAHHQVIGRRAAVKVLRAEHSARGDMTQRFFNEARAAAAIDHGGIVDVYDVGTTADGRAYLVMELLEGESLAARMSRLGALPGDDAVRIARQIAGALAAAHDRGIVHRDLKPDNVFLVPDPETTSGERVKLLDFGIAKLHGDLAADAPITRTGAIFGTPVYMAPEQCRGAEAVDHRADLYALGCILYHMVCGRPPFRGAGLGDLLSQHMHTPPTPPRALAPAISEGLEAIILCLLAKDPAHRFGAARAVINALDGGSVTSATGAHGGAAAGDAALARTEASIEPPSSGAATDPMARSTLGGAAAELATASPPPRPATRRRWVVPAALGAIGVAAAAAALLLWRRAGDSRRAPPPPPTPPTPRSRPRRRDRLSSG